MIGAGLVIASAGLIGSRRAEKTRHDARHDRSPRAGVSARLRPQSNRRARRPALLRSAKRGSLTDLLVADCIPLGWQRLKDSPGALPRRSGVVGRLPKTSGFQVDSAGIGLNCRAAEPGARGAAFISQNAPEVKGQDPR